MIAHIRPTDHEMQSGETHCRNVAHLAANRGTSANLESIARLSGLLHDMGKFTNQFKQYIVKEVAKKGEVHHSPTGAIFTYDRWYKNGTDQEKLTAQIVSMVIRGHHGGLLDCVNSNGDSPYVTCIGQDKPSICYEEAVDTFLKNCISEEDLDCLFMKACGEISAKIDAAAKEDKSYTKGMLARLILSCVVDADRWDSACFEANADPFEPEEKVDWKQLATKFQTYLGGIAGSSKIALLRGEISNRCLEAAKKPPGIYTLNVPTGGGKTFSSLRFAISHAQESKMERIFYVIPYNTILEQNAADIREALGEYDGILEHYGVFISNLDGEVGEREEARHTQLAERWNKPIILTSMVQFLDSAYRGGNTSARRFNRLARSVIVFDEIQALPKYCTVLFEKLVRFLTAEMGCTILLCTATQPNLNLKAESLLPGNFMALQYRSLKRVRLIDESETPLSYEEAAVRLTQLLCEHESVLAVVNTKAAAKALFAQVSQHMDTSTLCVHLSTAMCPAHRLNAINDMKERLGKEPVFCVSTMLIEAGVNISFPCVVRSLAGLPSVMQAAGRCNRHMELSGSLGEVFLWYLPEERLNCLPEIEIGQKCTRDVRAASGIGALDSREAMDWYFRKERLENEEKLKYPWKDQWKRNVTLTDMLSKNKEFRKDSLLLQRQKDVLTMYQAFETAGRAFRVIDQDTVSVLTSYGMGAELITKLCGELELKEKIRLMRMAQQYSVSVFRSTFNKLLEHNEVYPLAETGIYALRNTLYDENLGLVMEPSMMDFYNI